MMKLIKYLFNKWMLPIYAAVAAVFALVFALLAGGLPVFLRMLPIAFLLLWTLRATDDISDYEHDSIRKTQHLTRRTLVVFAAVTAVLFTVLSVLFFGARGLMSLAAVAYILLMERFEPLKILYLPLVLICFFWIIAGGLNAVQIAVSAGCMLASLAYFVYKRKVRK